MRCSGWWRRGSSPAREARRRIDRSSDPRGGSDVDGACALEIDLGPSITITERGGLPPRPRPRTGPARPRDGGAVDPQRRAGAGHQKQQAHAAVEYDMFRRESMRLLPRRSGIISVFSSCDAHEARQIAARRAVEPVRSGCGQRDEGRGLDEGGIFGNDASSVTLTSELPRPAPFRAVERNSTRTFRARSPRSASTRRAPPWPTVCRRPFRS
jgi:hypothetical protein